MYPGKRVNKQIGYLIKVTDRKDLTGKTESDLLYVPYVSYLHPTLIRVTDSIKMGWETLEKCEEALDFILDGSTELHKDARRYDIVKVTIIEELIDDDELEN